MGERVIIGGEEQVCVAAGAASAIDLGTGAHIPDPTPAQRSDADELPQFSTHGRRLAPVLGLPCALPAAERPPFAYDPEPRPDAERQQGR